jgi:5-formyltetrahydrofolate cyclo-ligase
VGPEYGTHLRKQATEDINADGGVAPSYFSDRFHERTVMTVADDKASLRLSAIAVRRGLAAGAPGAGLAVRDHLLAAIDNFDIEAGAVVAAFWSIGDEIDMQPALISLDALGFCCALPVVHGWGKALTFRRWTPATVLQQAGFGLLEPLADAPEAVPRLVLVPLLAFDPAGFRLGHGAGYYDRTLANLRAAGNVVAIGVAFSGQEIAEMPRAAHDERMDAIVTELGMKRFESGGR